MLWILAEGLHGAVLSTDDRPLPADVRPGATTALQAENDALKIDALRNALTEAESQAKYDRAQADLWQRRFEEMHGQLAEEQRRHERTRLDRDDWKEREEAARRSEVGFMNERDKALAGLARANESIQVERDERTRVEAFNDGFCVYDDPRVSIHHREPLRRDENPHNRETQFMLWFSWDIGWEQATAVRERDTARVSLAASDERCAKADETVARLQKERDEFRDDRNRLAEKLAKRVDDNIGWTEDSRARLHERATLLESALRAIKDEVDKAHSWHTTTGMKVAKTPRVPPSIVQWLKPIIDAALAPDSSNGAVPEDDAREPGEGKGGET